MGTPLHPIPIKLVAGLLSPGRERMAAVRREASTPAFFNEARVLYKRQIRERT